MPEHISPTRMNLLGKKAQIKLAIQGVDLLTRKKDALLKEFYEIIGDLYQSRTLLQKQMEKEVNNLILGESVLGSQPLASAAGATRQKVNVELVEKNLWGIKIYDLKHSFKVRNSLNRGYSPRSIESSIDMISAGFEKIVDMILTIVPTEIKLRRVGEEIKKTNRKINALQQQLIPQIRSQVVYISRALEEREREDIFRLKKIKSKKERQ